MKNFTDYSLEASLEGPCQLVQAFEDFEDNGGTVREFLLQFDFDSLEDMRRAAYTIMDRAANDDYLCVKEKDLSNRLASIHARFRKLDRDANKRDIWPSAIASELWNGGYSRKKLDEKVVELFSTEPDTSIFIQESEFIQEQYHLTNEEMEKLHFFVEQCKAMRNFPNSLRRMLYLWGEEKKTGKTTCASCLTEVLNGYTGAYTEAAMFTTTLSNEMQIGDFKVPRISECNVCMMDECFYADMGKTYTDFKRFITSSDGHARLPYGQSFVWHGLPNYIATSNDPLQKFIKDWNDRRYLSIEFREKPKYTCKDLDEIKEHWRRYVVNSTRTKDWYDWSTEIAAIADEQGERTIYAEEFANDLMQTTFLEKILERPGDRKTSNSNNRISLKFFVDYFRESMGSDASKKRGEIEKAVLMVFGERYNGYTWWHIMDLKKRAEKLLEDNHGVVKKPTEISTDDVPF